MVMDGKVSEGLLQGRNPLRALKSAGNWGKGAGEAGAGKLCQRWRENQNSSLSLPLKGLQLSPQHQYKHFSKLSFKLSKAKMNQVPFLRTRPSANQAGSWNDQFDSYLVSVPCKGLGSLLGSSVDIAPSSGPIGYTSLSVSFLGGLSLMLPDTKESSLLNCQGKSVSFKILLNQGVFDNTEK